MTTTEELILPMKPDSGSLQRSVPGRGRWLMAAALAGCMLLGLVIPFPVGGRLWSQLFDLAHAPAFCFLLLAVAGFIDPGSIGLSGRFGVLREVGAGETMVLAGGCLLLGCLGEFLQAFAGRSPGVADLVANAAGVVSGVFWMRGCGADGLRRNLLRTAAMLVLLAAALRPAAGIRGAVLQRADFPLLASFERQCDLGAWVENRSSMQRTTEWVSEGTYSLKVDLIPGSYSGVDMIWPPGDWRGYDELRWDLQNPGPTPIVMLLKIFDRVHRDGGFEPSDRFETIVKIPPGGRYELIIDLQQVTDAPENRTMNLAQVNGVELFAIDLPDSRTVYLDNMRLVKHGVSE